MSNSIHPDTRRIDLDDAAPTGIARSVPDPIFGRPKDGQIDGFFGILLARVQECSVVIPNKTER